MPSRSVSGGIGDGQQDHQTSRTSRRGCAQKLDQAGIPRRWLAQQIGDLFAEWHGGSKMRLVALRQEDEAEQAHQAEQGADDEEADRDVEAAGQEDRRRRADYRHAGGERRAT